MAEIISPSGQVKTELEGNMSWLALQEHVLCIVFVNLLLSCCMFVYWTNFQFPYTKSLQLMNLLGGKSR